MSANPSGQLASRRTSGTVWPSSLTTAAAIPRTTIQRSLTVPARAEEREAREQGEVDDLVEVRDELDLRRLVPLRDQLAGGPAEDEDQEGPTPGDERTWRSHADGFRGRAGRLALVRGGPMSASKRPRTRSGRSLLVITDRPPPRRGMMPPNPSVRAPRDQARSWISVHIRNHKSHRDQARNHEGELGHRGLGRLPV